MIKLAAVARRRWPLILACALLGLASGIASAVLSPSTRTELYTAEQVVLATNVGSAQDALVVTRGAIPRAAAKRLGTSEAPDVLASKIVVAFDDKTSSLTFSSNDADKDAAVKRVAAFVDAFLDASNAKFQSADRAKEKQIQQDITDNKAQLDEFDKANPQFTQPGYQPSNDLVTSELLAQRRALTQRASDLNSDLQQVDDNLAQTAPYAALGPEKPKPAASGLIGVPTSKVVRGGMGVILGALLGSIAVMMLERVNRRIDSRDELADITDLPVLAEIGWLAEKRRGHDDHGRVALTGVWAEPYRRVRSAVHFVQSRSEGGAPVRTPSSHPIEHSGASVFLVTSSSPGEGKSTTSALLAMALAEVGAPTVLIGADFRKPRVDRLVGIPASPSLRDFAQLDVNRPAVDDIVQTTHVRDLYAVASGAGTREVAGLVDATLEVCVEAVKRGATVVLDSSPIRAANDTVDLLPVVDYVIFAVRAGVTTEKDFLDTVAYFSRLDARILGIVLIGTRAARSTYYYNDYYAPINADPTSKA